MSMSDKTYDALKLAQKIFLVIAAFYSKLAEIWSLPFGDEVSETCLAIAAVLLGILEEQHVAAVSEYHGPRELHRGQQLFPAAHGNEPVHRASAPEGGDAA